MRRAWGHPAPPGHPGPHQGVFGGAERDDAANAALRLDADARQPTSVGTQSVGYLGASGAAEGGQRPKGGTRLCPPLFETGCDQVAAVRRPGDALSTEGGLGPKEPHARVRIPNEEV